ncbi:hypothetical protein [Novipirellula artificiosorum]|uniref:Secreted protein n=1 Tax=Novipirellula artificiosorum TaxID=2528016 RepID=A0A5C6DSN2_9BACT|nr:hypothetical protein [Novipirellula artificiosorum]TWU39214.1 hypothetical protein Poly41_20360 [Novipirellula artificiosorum]
MKLRNLVLLLPMIAFTACLVGCSEKKPVVIEATDESAMPDDYEEQSMGDSNNQ